MTADDAGKLLPPRKRAIFDYIVAHPCCDRAQITGYVYDVPRFPFQLDLIGLFDFRT